VNKSLLIVDDDDISRYLVKSLLGNNGYLLLEADRGTEALRLAREGRPDLIVLDLSMPDMSGFEVLDALKADSTTREIPVVIYTSQILTGPERERLEAAVDVVPKETVSREKAGARFAEALARGGLKMRLNVVEEQSV